MKNRFELADGHPQSGLILPMKVMKYTALSVEGLCYGLANMGLLFCLDNNEKELSDILDIIANTNDKNIDLEGLIKAARKQYHKIEMDIKKLSLQHFNYQSGSFDLVCKIVSEASRKEIQAFFQQKLNKKMENEWLKSRWKLEAKLSSVLNIQALFDGIVLLQNTFELRHLFSTTPESQDNVKAFSLILTESLKKKGGIKKIDSFTGVIHSFELWKALQELRQCMEEKPSFTQALALQINRYNHAISITYNPLQKKWICIDANRLPIKKLESDKEEEVASFVSVSFAEFQGNVISVNIFATGQYANDARELINRWHQKKPVKDMLEVTEEKLERNVLSDENWLYIAAKCGDETTVRKILGFPVYHGGYIEKLTPLHVAVINGHENVVRTLLAMGIKNMFIDKWHKAEIDSPNKDKNTPLHFAAHFNRVTLVKLLIQKGADIEAKDIKGRTPLWFAVDEGNLEVVRLLLESGAQINTRTKVILQETAFEIAIRKEHFEIAQLLCSHGAVDRNGKVWSQSEIAQLHSNHGALDRDGEAWSQSSSSSSSSSSSARPSGSTLTDDHIADNLVDPKILSLIFVKELESYIANRKQEYLNGLDLITNSPGNYGSGKERIEIAEKLLREAKKPDTSITEILKQLDEKTLAKIGNSRLQTLTATFNTESISLPRLMYKLLQINYNNCFNQQLSNRLFKSENKAVTVFFNVLDKMITKGCSVDDILALTNDFKLGHKYGAKELITAIDRLQDTLVGIIDLPVPVVTNSKGI